MLSWPLTTQSITCSVCGRKEGISAPGAILSNEGRNWWIRAGPLPFRGKIPTYIGQVLYGIASRTEVHMPTVNELSNVP